MGNPFKKVIGFLGDHGLDLLKTGLEVGADLTPGGGIAKDIITSIAGVKSSASDDELFEALNADPNKVIELREAQDANRVELVRLGIKRDEIYLQDKQNARLMETEKIKSGHKDSTLIVLLIVAAAGAITVASILGFGLVDPASAVAGFLFTVGGMFVNQISKAYDFYFGSSKGSKDKDALIRQNGKAA